MGDGAKVVTAVKLKGDPAEALAGFERGLANFSAALPPRVTGSQMRAFLHIAIAAANGRDVTMTEIREESGLGQHMNRSYQMFLPASPKDPEGLGWIHQVPDQMDGRKKYLKLTPQGEEIALKLASAIKGE